MNGKPTVLEWEVAGPSTSLRTRTTTAATDRHQWQIIQWPTGTGKTEALTVLCSTLGLEDHSAALIITKFTDEADELVRKINDQSGLTLASAAHGKASMTEQAMTESRVLVITHEAYRLALREAHDRPDSSIRLDLYHRHHHGTRDRIIIDEAFNWIDSYEVDLDELSAMCAALSAHVRNEQLDNLQSLVSAIRTDYGITASDRLLPEQPSNVLASIDFDHLKAIIKDAPTEAIELWRNANLNRRTEEAISSRTEIRSTTFKSEYLALLGRLDAIKRIGSCWLSQRRSRIRLHSSRLLLNTNQPCGVILDATASIDLTYDLLGDRVAMSLQQSSTAMAKREPKEGRGLAPRPQTRPRICLCFELSWQEVPSLPLVLARPCEARRH